MADKLIWIALAFQAGLIFSSVGTTLENLQSETEITHEEKPPPGIGQDTEDVTQAYEQALSLETLRQLSDSPNFEIRKAACGIVALRTAKGAARLLLLDDLASRDPSKRDKALTVLNYLLDREPTAAFFHDSHTYTAMISCLSYLLFEHTDPNHMFSSPMVPKTRPPTERKAIHIMSKLVAFDTHLALQCGIVTRWLYQYPFPFMEGDESRRVEVMNFIRLHGQDDQDMEYIFASLNSTELGTKHLIKCGFYTSEVIQTDDTWMTGGESTAGVAPPAAFQQIADDVQTVLNSDGTVISGEAPPRRHLDESAEERALRRRRREAMVLGEGGRPLGRENIFQRRPTGWFGRYGGRELDGEIVQEGDAEIEAEMERLRGQVEREDEVNGVVETRERGGAEETQWEHREAEPASESWGGWVWRMVDW